MLTVELYDRNRVQAETPLTLNPLRYDADAEGGPLSAHVEVSGQQLDQVRHWLGYYIIIRNGNMTPVWWGKVIGVTYSVGGIQIGVSLDDMRNKVKIFYTYTDGDGYPVAALTDWVTHDASIDVYGRRELRHSIAEASAEQADQMAATILGRIGLPRQVPTLGPSQDNVASLRCAGLWSLLNWTYYENLAGREVYDNPQNATQTLGWGVTSTDIGFADRYIQRMSGGLEGLTVGETITVSGSASNDGSYTVTGAADETLVSYTSSSIDFDAADDIQDVNSGLTGFEIGAIIEVSGSASNSGKHILDGIVNRGHITTDTAVGPTIVTEVAGPTITIDQAQMLEVDLAEAVFTPEFPGLDLTLTANGIKVAYSFTLTENLNWAANEIGVRLARVGAPGDNVKVELCADSAGAPGTVLDSATVTGTDILLRMDWVFFNLTLAATLSYGTTYWIVISRTGANSHTAYYRVGMDEDAAGSGTLKLWNGSSWVDRATSATMPFQVWGATETTAQISAILDDAGQFFTRVNVWPDSGLYRRQYRDGTFDALTELQALMDAGTTGADALLPMVTPDWTAYIDAMPASTDPPWLLRHGPKLTNAYGRPVDEGVLPVGQWCVVDGINSDASDLAPLSPFLIGYAEYSVSQGRITDIRAYGADDIWNFSSAGQG